MKKTFDLTLPFMQGDAGKVPERLADYLLDYEHGPRFLFDDLYHFGGRHYERHANNRNLLPLVKMMLESVIRRTWDQEQPLMMIPEAITNGRLFYDVAKKHERRIREARGGALSTYRLGEILNNEELGLLTEKNKNRAMERLEGFHKLFDGTKISPTGMEAMLATIVKEPGFTNHQMLRDEDFESFWIGVCLVSQTGGFAGDVAWSRNGNFETFALFQTQYGLIPFRPKGDTDIYFPNGERVTPRDYLEMLMEHIEEAVPHGFTCDVSVKMAMRMVMLEDMRVNGTAHPQWGPLDKSRMNPALANLPAEHDKAFAELADRLILFMDRNDLREDLGDLFGLADSDGLAPYFDRRLEEAKARWGKEMPPALSGRIERKLDMASVLAERELEDDLVAKIPYRLDGNFFSARPALFDEAFIDKVSERERLFVRAIAGLTETPSPKPLDAGDLPGEVLLFIDRRGGTTARAYADRHGKAEPMESRGVQSSFDKAGNFEEAVKHVNRKRSFALTERLRKENPDRLVMSLEDIEGEAESFRRNALAIAEPGGDRLSTAAKIALGEEHLTRRGHKAIFDRDWANSPVLTYLRLHARKIQLGLVERPANMPRHALHVGDIAGEKKGEPIFASRTLMDDMRELTGYMQRLEAAQAENWPRHLAKALTEVIAFGDLYFNKDLNRAAAPAGRSAAIDWQSVPSAFKRDFEARKEEFLALRAEAKRLILDHGITVLTESDVKGDLARIDEDYAQAWYERAADQRVATSRRPRDSSYQRPSGLDTIIPR